MAFSPFGGFGGFAGGMYNPFGGTSFADPDAYDPWTIPGVQTPQFGPAAAFDAPMDPAARAAQAFAAPQVGPLLGGNARSAQAYNAPVIGQEDDAVPSLAPITELPTSSMPKRILQQREDLADLERARPLSLATEQEQAGLAAEQPAIEKAEADEPTQTSGWRGAMGALGSVSNALLGFAGGALSGAPGNAGIGLGFQGMMQGNKQDMANRLLARKDAEKERKAAALRAFFADKGLSKEVQGVVTSDPDLANDIFKRMTTPKEPKYVTRKVDEDLYVDGKLVAAGEVTERDTPAMRAADALYLRSDPRWAELVKKSIGPQTQIVNQQENTIDRGEGENFLKQVAKIDRGRGLIQTYERMRSLNQNPNTRTGQFAKQELALRKILVQAGVLDERSAASTEALDSLAAKGILDNIGSLGSGVSNADTDLVRRITANITNTKLANEIIIEYGIRAAKRDIVRGQMAEQYAKENGGFNSAGFDKYYEEWAKKNSIYTPEEIARYEAIEKESTAGKGRPRSRPESRPEGVPPSGSQSSRGSSTPPGTRAMILKDGTRVVIDLKTGQPVQEEQVSEQPPSDFLERMRTTYGG